MEKAVILSDAVRTVSQLREEAQKLRECIKSLQGKINELKVCKCNCITGYFILSMHIYLINASNTVCLILSHSF